MIAEKNTILAIHNLCVDYVSQYGIVRAVNDVSLGIKKGKTLGLAGESGCGKSTLAFAIARLHKAPALIRKGKILFDQKDILTLNEKQLQAMRWSRISMVFQSAMNSLNPVISIGEQITDVIMAHTTTSISDAYDRAASLLEMVGIHASRLKSYPHQLSGGMRQRVAIAIAVALQPKLIIMDEPTTALDVIVEKEIIQELLLLKEKLGFSILFISHDLSLMGEIADDIGIMYAGQLVEYASSENIMQKPQHPYTQGLLASFPQLGVAKQKLEGIAGHPLNLLHPPQGCYFQDRCKYAQAKCTLEKPTYVKTHHQNVLCHYPITARHKKGVAA